MSTSLPNVADALVIGGGIMGLSAAYHLAGKGCRNVVLLEREPFFGAQTTGKCAGGVRYQFASEINIKLSQLSLPMLDRFEVEIGQPIGRRYCGYLFLVDNPRDMRVFRRSLVLQQSLGVQARWLDASEVSGLLPFVRVDDVLGATFCPRDGLADPGAVVQGYASAARRLGAKLFSCVEVTRVSVQDGRVSGVVTNRGEIATRVVVNAAGPWAGTIGEMAGVELPVVPLRRQIAVTGPLPELTGDIPMVVDFGRSLYFHREGRGILTGMSNPDEAPGFQQTVDAEWEGVHIDSIVRRVPFLAQAGLANRWAGLFEQTPDSHPLLGSVPEVGGLYCICGFSGHGFMHGPAAGLLLAEEIMDGRAHTLDISALNVRRFREGRTIPEFVSF